MPFGVYLFFALYLTADCGGLIFHRGLIGPSRQFGKHSIYGPELYALLFGALIPVPFWLWRRRFSESRLPHINMPVFLNGPSFIPPGIFILSQP